MKEMSLSSIHGASSALVLGKTPSLVGGCPNSVCFCVGARWCLFWFVVL